MAALMWFIALSLCLASFVHVANAGEACGYRYCENQCCDYDDSECCDEVNRIGAIIGLCVGAVVVIVVIVIIILICRRRRYRGVVYRGQPGSTVVVQQGVNANTGYVTQGMQPGVFYPPYQPYAPQPPYPQPGQAYPPAYPPAGPPPTMAQGPPSYDSLSFPNQPPQANAPAPAGGVVNQGYTEPTK